MSSKQSKQSEQSKAITTDIMRSQITLNADNLNNVFALFGEFTAIKGRVVNTIADVLGEDEAQHMFNRLYDVSSDLLLCIETLTERANGFDSTPYTTEEREPYDRNEF